MEIGDESTKEHKTQQIEMYRTRITELKAEYDMRIQALQVEIQALEREIQSMDTEKSHIKTVIQSFQKELEGVSL
jgi:predicted RNase H-like nuclease (RuvC/YqgF family)